MNLRNYELEYIIINLSIFTIAAEVYTNNSFLLIFSEGIHIDFHFVDDDSLMDVYNDKRKL